MELLWLPDEVKNVKKNSLFCHAVVALMMWNVSKAVDNAKSSSIIEKGERL